MTNERAIELLHRLQDEQFDGIHGDERREALSMAVRALESNLVKGSDGLVNDLVKDCISRQAAIDAVVSAMIDGADAELVEGVMELLPSAQPERKTGKWIRNDNGTYSCSVCQSWIPKEQHCYARYCLYCGADMRGGAEE